jgi:hypothetical protein
MEPLKEGVRLFTPPNIREDEEHFIRRLGWAVVRQWNSLPDDAKARIQQQAGALTDRYETVQVNEQISIFLEMHTGDPDA